MALSFCAKRMKYLANNILYKSCKRNVGGYIILVPEIGEDLPDKDPLMKEDGLPEFNTFTVEKVMASVGKQSVLYEQEIKKIEDTVKVNTENKELDLVNDVINQLEAADVRFHTIWGISNTLYFGNQSLMPTRYYYSIYNTLCKARGIKYMNRTLHACWKQALEDRDLELTPELQRLVEKNVREGRLNGLDLGDIGYARYIFDHKKVGHNKDQFRRMAGIATYMFKTSITNENVVKDFPKDFLKEIADDPINYTKGPWTMTLEPTRLAKFMKYCPDRELRWNVWQANVGRCSMINENTLRTSSVLENIRSYKMNQAKILGFKSYSHMSMETKMAESLNSIYKIMNNLLKIARPAQEQELKELTVFAKDRGFGMQAELRPWDLDYWSRKYLRSIYNFKEEVFCEYFPLPHVLKGLFGFVENLFNVRIIEGARTDVWHVDVRFFNVFDVNESSNEPIGHLYIDAYARGRSKLNMSSNTSWAVPIQSKSKLMNKKPLVAMIFNFPPPVGDTPSLLSFHQVKELFSETGLALQHLLTKVEYSDLAGTSNVEWEAAGIGNNLMVNFLYEPEVLKQIAKHYKTDEEISSEMINSIQHTKTHMAGYKLCENLYFSRLDLELYELPDFWVKIVDRLYKKHFAFPRDERDSHLTSWELIFSDNYSAAYYCVLWSKMLAADIHGAFEETSKQNQDQVKCTAARYRDTFLACSGSVASRELFRRFRGRDPNTMAFLEKMGLTDDLSASQNL